MIRAFFRIPSYIAAAAVMAAAAVRCAGAGDIYVTGFNDYAVGNLSGQLAWVGVGGSWATTGSTNSPFVPGSIIGTGTAPGVDPVGGTGRMARLCTERFASGRRPRHPAGCLGRVPLTSGRASVSAGNQ